MAKANTYSTTGPNPPPQASLEGKVLAILTLRRPATDGRLQRLIRSLSEACGYRTRLHDLSQTSWEFSQTPSPTPNHHTEEVRNTSSNTQNRSQLLKEKPSILYINSIDLQIHTLPNRIFYGQKIWLDLLENDLTNLRANGRRSGLYLSTYLWIVRVLQKTLPWNNWITVAEECFYNEIKFGRQKPVLLAHEMVQLPAVEHCKGGPLPVVLVTGTLGRHYGTLDALAWSRRAQKSLPHVLRIAGYAPVPAFAHELESAAASYPQVELELYEEYRPQEIVLEEMAAATYLLCPYHISPATRNRIPTKFHEAAHTGCTLIFPANPVWERWCRARNLPYLDLESLSHHPPLRRENLRQDWVQQRKALQGAAALAGLKAL